MDERDLVDVMLDFEDGELRPNEMTAEYVWHEVFKRPGMFGLVPKAEHRSMKAERDAALAAVERVRAIHKVKHGERPRYAADDYRAEREAVSWEKYSMCEGCSATWPCPTVAALDGAPEPEVKP